MATSSNRFAQDILIASVDWLKVFPEAINSVFPNTEVQLCIVHQIRNSLRFIGTVNQKQFAKELKSVYQAFTKEEAQIERNKWENLTVYFQYPEDILFGVCSTIQLFFE